MRALFVSLLTWCCPVLLAQTSFSPLIIDNQTAQQHLQAHPNLGIAPIAKMAHVFGDVLVQLKIDPKGNVVGAVVLSGAPMLIGSAKESAREWTFSPFTKDGQPVFATTVVNISYTDQTPLPKHPEGWRLESYYSAGPNCVTALKEAKKPKDAALFCARYSKSADALPEGQFLWERREAYLYSSNAYLHNSQPNEALAEAEKGVALVKSGEDDSHSIALAYGARALAEAQLHNLSGADADLAIAEQAERGAIATIQGDAMKKAYTVTLKSILQTHAQVLTAENNAAEAKIKSDEAANL